MVLRESCIQVFQKSSINLCESLATLTRKLCTEAVDPLTIEPLLANRLIPLDKGSGEARPTGVSEVIRRVIAKCVLKVFKQGVVEASGAMQVCDGQRSESEAAVHAIRNIFEADDTDAVLLVDASTLLTHLTEQQHCTTSAYCARQLQCLPSVLIELLHVYLY